MRTAEPSSFPRRVLLAVTGLSPQVLTETLFALAIAHEPPFLPTEIQLVTTAEGAERARLTLMGDEGALADLGREWGLGPLQALLPLDHVQVVRGDDGTQLQDILTPGDNVRAADHLVNAIRGLTADQGAALHISMAGGRKTMGFFAGYALSLYGREQDRLSHILVPRECEQHPQFFFPRREPRTLFTRDNRPIRPTVDDVQLAFVPFVRLRQGLPANLLHGESGWKDAVDGAQIGIGPADLVIDLVDRRVLAGGRNLKLTPLQLAWLLLLARRRLVGEAPLGFRELRADQWAAACRAAGARGQGGNISQGLPRLPDEESFAERVSRHNKLVRDQLGLAAVPYLVVARGRRPLTRYELALPAEQIRILHGSEPKQK